MDQTRPGVIEDSIFKTLDCSLSLTSSIGKYYDHQNHSLLSFAFLLDLLDLYLLRSGFSIALLELSITGFDCDELSTFFTSFISTSSFPVPLLYHLSYIIFHFTSLSSITLFAIDIIRATSLFIKKFMGSSILSAFWFSKKESRTNLVVSSLGSERVAPPPLKSSSSRSLSLSREQREFKKLSIFSFAFLLEHSFLF